MTSERPLWEQVYEEVDKKDFKEWQRRAQAARAREHEMTFETEFGKKRCLVCRQYLGPDLSHMR